MSLLVKGLRAAGPELESIIYSILFYSNSSFPCVHEYITKHKLSLSVGLNYIKETRRQN